MNVQSRIDIPKGLSIEAFLEWSERQADRYELVNGVPRLLPWVMLNHNRVVMNLTHLLHATLDLDRYELASGDFALKVDADSIRYADLMIVPAGKPGDTRFVEDARLVVEVLSKSTTHVDFGAKLIEYKSLTSVQTYLIFSQTPAEAWVWSRRADGTWPDDPAVFTDVAEVIDLPDLGTKLPLQEVYRNVL